MHGASAIKCCYAAIRVSVAVGSTAIVEAEKVYLNNDSPPRVQFSVRRVPPYPHPLLASAHGLA